MYSFGLICIYCELCERIRYGFKEISNAIYNLDWYTYPLEVQRMLPTIVNYAQQSVELEAFGNIPFTRDTFKRVIHKVYYTIFQFLSNKIKVYFIKCIFLYRLWIRGTPSTRCFEEWNESFNYFEKIFNQKLPHFMKFIANFNVERLYDQIVEFPIGFGYNLIIDRKYSNSMKWRIFLKSEI